MNILLTGATGFIGRHLTPLLLNSGHCVTVIVRDIDRVKPFTWSQKSRIIVADLHKIEQHWVNQIEQQDALIHLAWSGLPNYQALFHFEQNLPADYQFLKTMVEANIKHLLVTGTCFEYGMQSGMLAENLPTLPNNPYALAKDSLRKFLQTLQKHNPFVLQWARLFYMYGEGQNPASLMAQVNASIQSNTSVFNMSGGEQLRDYLPVEIVAEYLLRLIECRHFDGIINICSGQPISVKTLVENYLLAQEANMALNLGYYPYADNEPMAFWGDQNTLKRCLEVVSKNGEYNES